MKRIYITLGYCYLFFSSLFFPQSLFAENTDIVGTLPGSFSVGGDGTANYRVPLELPPGINGLTPSLALEYGSRKGNGLVGMGWRLTGFPAINRCATTLAQDGFIDGVDFDDNDKFCFKGQRLVAINGNYGANGTEYRTEQENDLKIISYGTAGNGPAYFKIWYKNGMIETFGETDDARFEAQGTSEVIGWSINKTEDRLGNLIHYFYTENHDDGEHFPQKITYANTTLNFNYDDNGYSVTSYLNGSRIIRRRHLTKIAIQAGSTTQFYQLRYDHSVNDRQHWLKGLTRCTAEEVCLPETQFNWEHAEAKVTPYRNISLATPGLEHDQSQYRWLTGDVNGDGATDLIAARLTKTGNVATVRLGVPGDP
uniref:SpvB/TcaC N-terminal domain-containing protein n=2 Tax=Zooshikella ganghwensis TaxID=202772 RepID=UPI002278EA02